MKTKKQFVVYYEYTNRYEGRKIFYLESWTTYGFEVFKKEINPLACFDSEHKANMVIKRHNLSHCKVKEYKQN